METLEIAMHVSNLCLTAFMSELCYWMGDRANLRVGFSSVHIVSASPGGQRARRGLLQVRVWVFFVRPWSERSSDDIAAHLRHSCLELLRAVARSVACALCARNGY